MKACGIKQKKIECGFKIKYCFDQAQIETKRQIAVKEEEINRIRGFSSFEDQALQHKHPFMNNHGEGILF